MSDTYTTYEAMQQIITETRASSHYGTVTIQEEEVHREDKEEKKDEKELNTTVEKGSKGKRKLTDRQKEETAPAHMNKSSTTQRERASMSSRGITWLTTSLSTLLKGTSQL